MGAGVAYEQKFDGHRARLFTPLVPGGQVLIQTRRGSMVQDRFPDLVAAAVEQLPPGLVLDGELLVRDPEAGALSFEALQRRAAARLGLDQGSRPRHHRGGHRRRHWNPDPPRSTCPRPLRRAGPTAGGGPYRRAAPTAGPPGR
ncbi:ATP-dependent DNA ligase [Streptomyces vinaceus]|uniref:ATP-dependent DNA ligase n=1 Tax=Streptomyces vinaceus TaxID=1960 RepID=UPI0035DD5DBB